MSISTSIEQSKKLLSLGLKPETADMWWNCYSITYDIGHAVEVKIKPWLGNFNWFNREDNIPCWSLSALLDLIPVRIITDKLYLRLRMDKGKNDFSIWYDDFSVCGVYEDADFTCEEPIDAAVEMIEWLITNKHLNV